jgi:MoaA/NifB/PqqE/SkfB family radical SAM enzyme
MRLLGNDLVINENDCNLSCVYCLTGQSNLKRDHLDRRIFQPPRRDRYGGDSPLGMRIDQVIDRIADRFGAPLLKITGGEIFLVKDIEALIEKASDRFTCVVIQTNAALIGERQIERLTALPNIVLQVSLDSHTAEGNSYRVARADLHAKILRRVEAILSAGLGTEVYTVLTDRSVANLEGFAEWLAAFRGDLTWLPFPVRGPDSDRFAARNDQIALIEKLAGARGHYASILPPPAYFDRLLRFYRDGDRQFRCHLPRLVISTFSDGAMTPCPNIWFSDLGNILEPDWEANLDRVGTAPLYHALLGPRPRLDACKKCFTPWDLLSMYMDGEITLEELCSGPVYRHPAIRALLADVRADLVHAAAPPAPREACA